MHKLTHTMSKNRDKENAVSPVIGVMLMLVVTIVIAAFVAAFAGGMFSTTQAPPSASIGVNIIYNGGFNGDECVMLIENKGGDTIPTSDLRIMTYYTSLTGSKKGSFKNEVSASSSKSLKVRNATGATNQMCIVPVLSDASKGDVYGSSIADSNKEINFGYYNFAPGNIMSSYNSFGTGSMIFGQTSEANAKKYLNKDPSVSEKYTDFGVGSKVSVEIIHTPTSTVLYSKDVIVS